MPVAYCYHRYSSRRQDDGMSLERQRERTAALCKKNGWEIAQTLEDKGRSAWKGDHLRVGELGRFKDRLDAGLIEPGSILCIENLDRLSRQDVKTARRWIEDVTDAGIIVAVCTPELIIDEEALSGTNIVAMIQYLLEAKRSTGESSRKSDMQHSAIAKMMEKAREGTVFTQQMPAWLTGKTGGTFEVIEERAQLVRQIYEWSAAGLGMYAIAKKLNDSFEPWTKPYKSDKPTWRAGYVRQLLNSPAVEGEYHVKTGRKRTPTGEVLLNYYPRIVPAELVARARNAQLGRKGITGVRHSEARNLFAGRVKCGHCGDTMIRVKHTTRGKEYEYLKCVRFNDGADCENTTLYRYDLFEPAALDQVLHLALDDTFFIQRGEVAPLLARVADLRKAVELKEAEQKRLLAFIMRNDEAKEAEDQINLARPALAALRNELTEAELTLARARGSASPEEHLQRVLQINNALYSDDDEARFEARRRVRDAIQEIVDSVTCSREYVDGQRTPDKEITMTLVGGAMRFRFDGEGKLIDKTDHLNEQPVRIGYERDYAAEETRRASGDPEFTPRGKFIPLWKESGVTVPASDALLEGLKHDNPDDSEQISAVARRNKNAPKSPL